MNDAHDNAADDREMLERLKGNLDRDLAEMEAMLREIMAVIPVSARTLQLELSIRNIMVRHIRAAEQAYEEQLRAEQVHRGGRGRGMDTSQTVPEHAISACSVDFCGRYAGQRRDGQPGHTAYDCRIRNCVWHPSAEVV